MRLLGLPYTIRLLIIVLHSFKFSEAAACQSCLFSLPWATTQVQHHRHSQQHTAAFSALLPFGIVAAKRFAATRYESWYWHSQKAFETKKSETNDSNNDAHKEEGAKNGEDYEDAAITDKSAPDAVLSSAAIGALRFYKGFISPLLPPACRFVPTCSQYGVQAIQEYGTVQGGILIAWRLLRCSPLGGKGYDPPKWPPVPFTYSSY